MKPILFESERCYYREFQNSDASFLFTLNSLPEVMLYTGDLPFKDQDDARAFVQSYNAYRQFGFGRWALVEKQTNKMIGWCGLKQHKDFVDLGFRFHSNYWGKGYATEAASRCLHYGFQEINLHSIVGRVAEANIASIRVLEKVGMKQIGHSPCEGISEALRYEIINPNLETNAGK